MDDLKELIFAGTASNIIIYDSEAKPGEFTQRFFELIFDTARRNIGWPTDIYVGHIQIPTSEFSKTVNWHIYSDDVWKEITDYFYKTVENYPPADVYPVIVANSKPELSDWRRMPKVLLGSY